MKRAMVHETQSGLVNVWVHDSESERFRLIRVIYS